MADTLFPLPPSVSRPSATVDKSAARVLVPNREQIELRSVDLEGLLPADHRARTVWAFVERLDLGPLYDAVKSVEGGPGRPAIDPRILAALWLYATLDAVGSARALARLCEEHDAYRWICGGVGVNYHTLADFRVLHVDFLDQLLTSSVATLVFSGAVTLNRVAQDGVRVRANAGAPSFRRRAALERAMQEAQEQVRRLREELDDDPGATSRRQQAARERAARERQERIARAMTELERIEELRRKTDQKRARAAERKAAKAAKAAKKEADPPRETEEEAARKAEGDPARAADEADKKRAPRVSTTDPEARVMKGPDGGYRPSYNGQFTTDTDTQLIVGVDVTNEGSDQGQLTRMTEQVCDRYCQAPRETLVDGGFASLAEIDLATKMGTKVYAPVFRPKDPNRDPYAPLPKDSEHVGEWRKRMGTDEAKAIYKQRAATAECVNALARNRGLRQFPVRGRPKVKAVLLWFALAHNLLRIATLWPQMLSAR